MDFQRLLRRARTPIGMAGKFIQTAATGQIPQNQQENIMNNLVARKIVDRQFEDPIDRQLKEAQIKSYKSIFDSESPVGYIKIGNKILPDKTFVNPNEKESPLVSLRKEKSINSIYDTVSNANLNIDRIDSGIKSIENIPQGLPGMIKLGWMKAFDTKNPTLSDWQNMKSLLTDAQLQKTAKTSGSISDFEMKEFAKSVANDDLASVARQTNVLNAFRKAIISEQESKLNQFRRSFKEDPREWDDLGYINRLDRTNQEQSGQLPPEIQDIIKRGGRVLGVRNG